MRMNHINITRPLAFTLLLGMALLATCLIAPPQASAMMMAIPEEIGKLSTEEQDRWVEQQTRGGLEEKIEVGIKRHEQRMAIKTDIANSMSDFSVARLEYIRAQQETSEHIMADRKNNISRYGIPGIIALMFIILGAYLLCRKWASGNPEKISAP